MILIIDNYDSFTYNLYQQIEKLGKKTKIYTHDEVTIKEVKKLNPEKIIISPGPKTPSESGISIDVIKNFYKSKAILGVCLGHQCIAKLFNSKVVHAKEIKHGKTSKVYHTEDKLFNGIKNPFNAARYHSLAIKNLPKGFVKTAWTKDNEIMAIHHEKYPLFGIQFHPESFLTEEGDKIMHNFLYEV